MNITNNQSKAINNFLFGIVSKENFSDEQRVFSYKRWHIGGRGWFTLRQGGTGQMLALMWYHHIYKPNSKEWRPSIIINEICSYLKI